MSSHLIDVLLILCLPYKSLKTSFLPEAKYHRIVPRLEENSFLGVEDFIKRVEVKNIIPMHMWDKYKIAEELEKRVNINVIRIVKNCEKIFEI